LMGLVNEGHLLLTRRLRSWFPAQQRHSITKPEPVWQPVLETVFCFQNNKIDFNTIAYRLATCFETENR
jgi:hypothetical protein